MSEREATNTNFRKKTSGVVINTSKSELMTARRIKNQKMKQEQRLQNLEDKVESLDAKLDKILSVVSASMPLK